VSLTKVLICPFFGDLPPWYDHWLKNTERMREHGYDFLFDNEEDAFRDRVREILGIEAPPMWGHGKVWDFRPALGLLYADEIAGFDFWGHCDFDVVFGRVERWITDELLSDLDVFSNHATYISGPFSLYRNHPFVNALFLKTEEWRLVMQEPTPSGWAEKGFTAIVNHQHEILTIRRRFESWQTKDWDNFDTLRLTDDGRLMEGDTEVMLAHFRRTKQYPPGCILTGVV